jgi:predicted Rossmann-fold nucleotide-binding protein
VYAPGGAGTAQEIFTDAAQNTNTLYEVRSPMVFFERAFYEETEPELLAAVRRQAAAFGWAELVTVVDAAADVVAFLGAHPDDRGSTVVRGRRRPDAR